MSFTSQIYEKPDDAVVMVQQFPDAGDSSLRYQEDISDADPEDIPT